MGSLAIRIDWTAAPDDPASLVAVFSLPVLWISGILIARHRQRRRDR